MENTLHIDQMQIDNADYEKLDSYTVLLLDFRYFKYGTLLVLRELFASLMKHCSFSALSSDELLSYKEELDRYLIDHQSLKDRLESTIMETKINYGEVLANTYPDSLICKLYTKKIHRTSRRLEYVMFVLDISGYLTYYSKMNSN